MNIDSKTVKDFGAEWSKFNQSELKRTELEEGFEQYFGIFPWESLPKDAVGFDMGCGSGRWAKLVAPRVGKLICIDASKEALEIAKINLGTENNCEFSKASVDEIPLEEKSMDFGYSLGVLHHIPDTQLGIDACVNKLKKGSPFLVYLYYAFDNRATWFRLFWRVSDLIRKSVSNLPTSIKHLIAEVAAFAVYFPLARAALLLEKIGLDISAFPLAYYRNKSFYAMRTDSLDRFGTRLEHRFTRKQIEQMMLKAGLKNIKFSDDMPFWCAVGIKK